MASGTRNPFLSRSFQRTLGALTRSALRAGSKVVAQALRAVPGVPKRKSAKSSATRHLFAKKAPAKRALAKGSAAAKNTRAQSASTQRASASHRATPAGSWSSGMAAGAAGARGYRLYQPPAVLRTERLPLLVMLHGCAQDAQALADSSRIDRIAARAARHCPDHVLQTARAEAGQSAYLSTVRWRTQALR